MIVRVSSLPLAFTCPGSVRTAEVQIDSSDEAARIGTASHEGLAKLAEEGGVPWGMLKRIAAKHQVPESEVRMLCALGAKLWEHVSDSFADAVSEVELSSAVAPHVHLMGHVDLLSISGGVARAGDWKTGRKDSDYAQQMRGYCALLLLDNDELTEVSLTLLWVRDQEIENYTMRREQLSRWLVDLVDQVINWDGVFHPGTHCTYCPRSHECDAGNAYTRRDIAALADKSLVARAETDLHLMSPAEIVDLHAKAEMVSKYSKRVLDAIKEHVSSTGDIVGDGYLLTMVERNKRVLDPEKAWPVLEDAGFGVEEFSRVVNLRVGEINSIVAKRAGRGKGAAAVRELTKALEAVEAIHVDTSEVLARKRA